MHISLRNGLCESIKAGLSIYNDNVLHLKLGIDGLPLFNSENAWLRPILCSVQKFTFTVTWYQGQSKPSDLEKFIRPAITELQLLLTDGLRFNGTLYRGLLNSIIADTPARAFIKSIIGHTGYGGCERCAQRGKYFEGQMTFQSSETKDAPH